MMVGIESIKENSNASSDLSPNKIAPAIVIPEREIPGKMAKPCSIPIIVAIFRFNCPFSLFLNLVRKRQTPVTRNSNAVDFKDAKLDSKYFLRNRVITEVAKNATIIFEIFSFLRKKTNFFRKYTNITNKVAR